MKRTLKFALIACFVLGFSGAFAQENTEELPPLTRYPHYGFWSNWSFGLHGGWTYRLQKETIDPAIHATNPHERLGWGIGGFFAKELNHVWDVRFQAMYADVDTKIKNINLYRLVDNKLENNLNYIGEHLNLDVTFTFSIIDAIKGYKEPYRPVQWYLLAGMGGTVLLPDNDRVETDGNKSEMWLGDNFYTGHIGMGISWRFIDRMSVFVEPTLYALADFTQINKFDWVGNYLYIPIGLEFHFGVMPEDKARIDQERFLTKENFDKLKNDLDDANDELAKSKDRENNLKNKIASLEDENGKLKDQLDKSEAENGRLRNALKNIKDNQGSLYGMPLSILYPNDVWKVPADQMNKLKAVAEVMKNNPNTKFTIISYCDEPASYEYNDKLSEKRATEAKRLLVEKYGVDPDRLSTQWKGKRECFGDCKFSINRRTSFYVNMDEE
ncbi:MAG: OmpA family protein [Bacteroidales bacterium]|nr:OmpA family protein [Bacteroidales bacterium]